MPRLVRPPQEVVEEWLRRQRLPAAFHGATVEACWKAAHAVFKAKTGSALELPRFAQLCTQAGFSPQPGGYALTLFDYSEWPPKRRITDGDR